MRAPYVPSFLLLFLLLGSTATIADAQTVLHVKKGNQTPGDGLSWASAFRHPLDAFAAADTISGPVEIWVTTATYLASRGSTDRTISLELRGDLEFLGGFVGTETDKEQRDPAANVTILSGDINLNASYLDNSYHVLRADGLTGPVVIDGFHVTQGNAIQTAGDGLGGGGLLVRDADVTLRRCYFFNNWSGGVVFGPDFGDLGGAVHVEQSGVLTVEECIFRANEAYYGAAISVSSDSGDASVSISDSEFDINRAPDGGGAGISMGRGSLIVENTTFTGNRARLGIAISATLLSELILRDCLFEGNQGAQRGTVRLDRCDGQGQVPAIIERCLFLENEVTGGTGGAMTVDWTLLRVRDCEFRRNTNLYVDPDDGEMRGWSTVSVVGGTGHEFTNCLLADNVAAQFAGMVFRSAQTTIVNTTIANNHSASADSISAGVATTIDGDLAMTNVILWGNRYATGANDDQPGSGGLAAQIYLATNSDLSVSHCDIEGWTDGAGDQVFSADPLFVNPALEDYRLQGGSPAIDAGENAAVASIPTDLDGDPRIMDGLGNGGMRVDVGAYEFFGQIVAAPPAGFSSLSMRVWENAGLYRVEYRLPRASHVRIDVFDLRGRRVRQLLNSSQNDGDRHSVWDGKDDAGRSVASGVYLMRLAAGRESATGKIVVLR